MQTPGLSKKRVRASLSDLSSLEDVEGMSVRQLKEILARNFVNYSGCCEKWELVEKVNRLYKENEENQKSCRFPFSFFPLYFPSLEFYKLSCFGHSEVPFFEKITYPFIERMIRLNRLLLGSRFIMLSLRPPLPRELGHHLFSLVFLAIIC